GNERRSLGHGWQASRRSPGRRIDRLGTQLPRPPGRLPHPYPGLHGIDGADAHHRLRVAMDPVSHPGQHPHGSHAYGPGHHDRHRLPRRGRHLQGRHHRAGLTTAASIWITAALGILIGIGFYFPATVTTALAIFVLSIFRWVESHMRT